jgi:hypothetical protein
MRQVNQRAVHRFQGAADDQIEFACECGDVACFETVALTPSDYYGFCASGDFLLAPGHLTPGAEKDGILS